MKLKKWVCVLLAVFLLAGLFCMPALAAADDVADAVENTWTDAAEQIKTVVDSVVFPALSMCTIQYLKGVVNSRMPPLQGFLGGCVSEEVDQKIKRFPHRFYRRDFKEESL